MRRKNMKERKPRNWHACFELKWQDAWIGAFWKRTGNCIDLWICLIPCVPLHVSWWWSREPGSVIHRLVAEKTCGNCGRELKSYDPPTLCTICAILLPNEEPTTPGAPKP